MARKRSRKRITRSRRIISKKPTARRQTLVQQIISGLTSPNYDIDEFQTGLL